MKCPKCSSPLSYSPPPRDAYDCDAPYCDYTQPLERLKPMIILGQLEAQLQHLYDERALLLALLTKHYPYTIHVDQTILDSPNRFVLFLDLPTGQVSFHIHEKNIDDQLFPQHSPPLTVPSPWDGHSISDKMDRLKKAAQS